MGSQTVYSYEQHRGKEPLFKILNLGDILDSLPVLDYHVGNQNGD